MRNTWIKGTLVLAGAAFVARFLGVVQRIPLQRILDDIGMASYAMAYNVYFWLLVLATAGIPSALAKLVAEKEALGRYEESARIRTIARRWGWGGGLLMALTLFWGAPWIANRGGNPDAVWAIRALSPALLLFPWVAVERGYFHGRQRMLANGLSQVGEQILRVLAGVAFAYALMVGGYGVALAAAGASFGGVLGAMGAALVMVIASRRLARSDVQDSQRHKDAPLIPASSANEHLKKQVEQVQSAVASEPHTEEHVDRKPLLSPTPPRKQASLFASLVRLAVPTSITALAVPTLYLIDTLLTIPLLQPLMGVEEATRMLGILGGRAQSLAGIPVIFAIALSQSIMPLIAATYAKQEHSALQHHTERALWVTVLLGVPVILVLIAAVDPINTLLFGNTVGSIVIATVVATVVFQLWMMTSGSILLGLGKPLAPMLHIACGLLVKLIGTWTLAPLWGIMGIVVATAACFATTMALNLWRLRQMVPFSWSRRYVSLGVASGAALVVGSAVSKWSGHFVQPFALAEGNAFCQATLIGVVVLFTMGAVLWGTKAIQAEDMRRFFSRSR